MSREEQLENALKRFRRYYDTHRKKYFTDFQISYYPWSLFSF
jgi:acyl-CoA oxidase